MSLLFQRSPANVDLPDRGKAMQDIIDYYDETTLDYRLLWLNGSNRAIHFGYYDTPDVSHADALVRLNEKLAELGQINPGDKVLDAGCGVGGSSFWLAENKGATVTGITPVHTQVEKANELKDKRNLDGNVSFKVADYRNTPFESESFDVVWACESVCHAPDKADFYNEAYRLLKPGGRLVMAEYFRAGRPLNERGEKLLSRWLQGWAIGDIDSRDEHASHITNAGFSHHQLLDVTERIEPSLRRLYRMSSLLYPLAIFFVNTRIRTATQHGNVVGAVTQYKALEGELLAILHGTSN